MKLRSGRLRLTFAVFICSLSWMFGAINIMSSAFTNLQCTENCTTKMVTVVKEFNLEGENAYLSDWSTSAFMFGNMLGGTSFTHVGDRFGRRPILLVCAVGQIIASCMCALSNNIFTFSICRFLQGALYTGFNLIAWVSAYELCIPKHRGFCTLLFGLTWTFGYCILALIAIVSPTWRILTISTIPALLLFTLVVYLVVPESLHYLILRKRADRVLRWMEKIDDEVVNKVDFLNLLDPVDTLTKKPSSIISFLKQREYILYTMIQLFIWTTDNFIYFGLSLYSTQLDGNIYINFILMGIVELPAYVICPVALEKIGRKMVVAGCHIVAGITFLIPLLFPAQAHLTFLCWLLGKFCISCSFMALFVYASEIFSTEVRNVSIGICSVLSRFGCIFAPYIRYLSLISSSFPLILLSSISIAAGCLTFILPETRRKLLS